MVKRFFGNCINFEGTNHTFFELFSPFLAQLCCKKLYFQRPSLEQHYTYFLFCSQNNLLLDVIKLPKTLTQIKRSVNYFKEAQICNATKLFLQIQRMEIFCIQIIFNFWYIITKEKCINKNERVCMCNYSNVVVEITKDHALFEKCLKLIENWYGALT